MNGVTEESSGGTTDGNHTDRQNRVSRNESPQTGRRASLLALVAQRRTSIAISLATSRFVRYFHIM